MNNPDKITCPICLSEEIRELSNLFDDRYGYQGIYHLFKCRKCEHIYLEANFIKESLESLYTEYYPRSVFTLDSYTGHKEIKGIKKWLNGANSSAFRWVPEKVRVLDIGCGFCETLGYHKARGCDVYGVETDENVRRVAEKYGYNIYIGIFDSNMYEQEYFDYVTMDQVMEHVVDPVETMRGIARILKKGGRLIVSTPNAGGWGAKIFRRRWINWHAPYHLHHFSFLSMKIAAEKSGLVVEKVSTITSSEWLHYQWSHLCTFPGIGVPSGFWSPKRKLNLFQKSTLFLLNILHKSKVNHFITRFFDSINFGDNLLFILRKS